MLMNLSCLLLKRPAEDWETYWKRLVIRRGILFVLLAHGQRIRLYNSGQWVVNSGQKLITGH